MKKSVALLILTTFLFLSSSYVQLPGGFAYIDEEIPNIELDIRYYGSDNFVGQRVDGYDAPKAIATKDCIEALKKVQFALNQNGMGLIVYDAYRPQKAVNHFKRWAEDPNDTLTKAKYYPNLDKVQLIPGNYIAERSSHSRGSTVDVGLIDLNSKMLIDMGTGWDFFGPESWPVYEGVTKTQYKNRMLLANAMINAGFEPYNEEWWHFTLKNEPFAHTYFDFNVQ